MYYNLLFIIIYIVPKATSGGSIFSGHKLDEELESKVKRCLIPPERLCLGKKLGKGNFGSVYQGQLTTKAGKLRTVAVKSIKG